MRQGHSLIPQHCQQLLVAGRIPFVVLGLTLILVGWQLAREFIAHQRGFDDTVSASLDTVRALGAIAWVFVLVVAFTFFYTLVVFNQQQLAENLQKNGVFVLGIRPGKPTQDYLNRVIVRITLGGALFLGFIAIVPYIASLITDVQAISLSSTSLLIMVGVGLDTLRQLEAQLMMRNYEGFLR